MAIQARRLWLSTIALTLGLVGAACEKPPDPQTLVRQCFEAHGGQERLARFRDVHIVSDARYKDAVSLRRIVDWRGVDSWSMTIESQGRVAMNLGISQGRCWTRNGYWVNPCPADGGENRRIATLFAARLLQGIDGTQAQAAESVEIDGREHPAAKTGEVVLVFDPELHFLKQVRFGERVDTFSENRIIANALLPMRRVLTIGGQLDLDETWTKVVPGGADSQALIAPELPRAGLVVEADEPARPIAWTEVEDPVRDGRAALAKLESFVRRQGRMASGADGVIWIPPPDGVAAGRWRIVLPMEAGAPLQPIDEGDMHFAEMPEMKIVGVFQAGDPVENAATRALVRSAIEARGLMPVPEEQWQIHLAPHDGSTPKTVPLSLVRIAVAARSR